MKKITKELIFIIVISFIICIVNIQKVNAAEGNDGVAEQLETSVVKLTSGNTETYYDHLDIAIEDATNGNIITLLGNITEGGYKNTGSTISLKNSITFELGTFTILSKRFEVINGSVVDFNASNGGGIISKTNNDYTFYVGMHSELTLNNVKIVDTGNHATIFVRIAANFYTEGNTNISTASTAIDNNGNAHIEGNTKILSASTAIENDGYFFIEENSNISATSNAIENNNSVRINNLELLESKEGYAINLVGDYPSLRIDSGKLIKGKKGAIYADNDSNPSVYISGGTISSENGVGMTLNNGSFCMEGGTINGIIGILLNGGYGEVDGGTVNGTGSGTGKIAGIDNDLELGSSIAIVGPVKDYYPGITTYTVEIGDGTFNSEGTTSLYSNLPESKNFLVEGGTFSKPFDMKYAREGRLMLHITKEGSETWYLGTAAKSAIGPNKKIAGAEIEVLQGDLTITDGIDGLKVKNSGVGKVVANNKEVAQGSEITIGQTSGNSNSSGTDTTDTTDTTNDSQTDGTGSGLTKISPADSTVAGKKLPKTGDLKTILLVVGALIASLSIIITYLKIRRAEGK